MLTRILPIVLILFLAPALSADVRTENVSASQRGDGSRVIDIHYDLPEAGKAVRVDFVLSSDGGRSWNIVPSESSLSGDFGADVSRGSGKHIVYDALGDRPGLNWGEVKARVWATQGIDGESVKIHFPGDVPIEFVRIPPGEFLMGSPDSERGRSEDEGPQHRVKIDYEFYMSKYLVTQSQWKAVMGRHPAKRYGIGDNFPVFYVSFDMARDFSRQTNTLGLGNFRLPSEAEWEYACRAGTTTRYYFGDSLECDDDCGDCEGGGLPGKRSDFMWYCANHGGPSSPDYAAKPVGKLKPNAFGLHDMNGNLWEFCLDAYHPTYDGAPTDGRAWLGSLGASRVLRGGSWDYHAHYCRSASRNGYVPWRGYTFHGVRLVWLPAPRDSDGWMGTWEAGIVADNMISYQNKYGAWPKNLNMYEQGYQGEKFTKNWGTTLDNGATIRQMRFLARHVHATGYEAAKKSFLRGLEFLFRIQYPNGGFPQRYPPGHDYGDLITFNDDVMARALRLMRDIAQKPEFDFVPAAERQRARASYEKGLQSTLDCQVVVDGRRTVWGAQHDPETLAPRAARAFEPNGLCSRESAEVVVFLMSIPDPSPAVKEAVEAAVAWFKDSKLTGTRLGREDGDLKLLEDPTAPAIWARFYELGTARPVFSGMDGVVKYSVYEIGKERRNGYGWFGRSGDRVFQEYEEWRKRTGN